MVPEGWEKQNADLLCSLITKGTTPKKDGLTTKTTIPFLRVNNLRTDGAKHIHGEMLFVTNEVHQSALRRSICKPGDVLMNIVGPPLGKTALLGIDFREYNMNQAILVFRPRPHKLDNEFLFYSINSYETQSWLERRAKKTSGQKNLTIELCKELPILVPPLPEQKKIAEILSTWDRAIEVAERQLETARLQKKALMQQLLTGTRRLPGFDGEWKTVKLGDVTKMIRDGTHGTHERFSKGVPMLSAVNVGADHLLHFEGAPLISEEDYSKIHSKYEISEGDVLLTVVGTLGRVAVVRQVGKFTLQRSVAILRTANDYLPDFLSYVLQSVGLQGQIKRRANVTAQPGIYLGEVGKLLVPCPSLSEQGQLVEALDTASRQIVNLTTKLTHLRTEKRALMQQLLTGKKRVTV